MRIPLIIATRSPLSTSSLPTLPDVDSLRAIISRLVSTSRAFHRIAHEMFLLRRAAVRALSQQASPLSRTYQQASCRVTSFSQSRSKPIAWREFHQARIWRAEEEQKGALTKEGEASPAESENAEETVKTEPSVDEQMGIEEESIASPEVADAASHRSTAETVTGKARDVAASATEAFSEAAQSGAAALGATGGTTTQRSPQSPRRPQPTSSFRNPRPSRILYVGNLFFEVKAQQLESEFTKYGEIVNSRIVTDSRGLSKGFGYIEMATQEAADSAVLELNQKVLQGRRMAVQYHIRKDPGQRGTERQPRMERPPNKTLFIGNLSYQMSDRDLNDLFREIRDVLDVRVAIDRRSGQPRGFAHADFIDVAAAQRAKEHLEKKVVYGRQLRIDFSASTSNDGAGSS